MSESMTLKDRWMNLSPGARIGFAGGGVLLILIAVLMIMPSRGSGDRLRNTGDKPVKASMLLPRAQDQTVEQLSGGLTANEREIAGLKRDLGRMKDERREMQRKMDDAIRAMGNQKGDDGISSEVLAEIQKLKSRIEANEAREALSQGAVQYPSAPVVTEQDSVVEYEETPLPPPSITVVGEEETPKDVPREPEEPAPYLTANSMFEAELLNGMDAPTDQSSRRNPVPAVMRIKSEAILPNMFNVPNIQECFLSVSGYGDMADERAKLRTEMLSCVVPSEDPNKPPRIVEAKVDGYVVGEDGRVGMRGRLVSKQGQIIAKTLLAGVLSGLGDGLKPQQIQGLDLNPTGTSTRTQTNDAQTIASSGLAQGLSDTAKSISQYYLKLADQMMPILEIDSGRKGTVVLLKGVELK